MMNALAAYLFSLLVLLSPIEAAVARTHLPLAKETVDQRTERYEGIATSLAEVIEEESLPFSGSRSKGHTGALVLAIAFMESGFRRDVDLGLGKEARGGGMDSCLMQIRLGKDMTTPEGWTAQDVMTDRKKCFTAALRMIRRSIAACRAQPLEERLGAYASGICTSSLGAAKSKARWSVYRHLVEKLVPPKNEVLSPDPISTLTSGT